VVRNNSAGPNLGEFSALRHVGHGRSCYFGASLVNECIG
jgi:hypothetical protein